MQQGKANSNYTPFHTTKQNCGDDDEASDLALKPEEVTGPKPGRIQLPPDPVTGYPPNRRRGAKVVPVWLSCQEWLKVRALRSRGKNILEIAESVDKNASKLRLYIDTYLSAYDDADALPSAKSTDSSTNSTAGSAGTDEGLFPLYDQATVFPDEGMPHPSFLNRQEQEVAWKMFQQHKTVREMTERLHKNRHRLSQYLNAYMRPKLLELQAKEREAENAATPTPITPLTLAGDILQFPPYSPVEPAAAAPRSTSPVGGNHQTPTSAVPGPTYLQDSSLHGAYDAELDAFQREDNLPVDLLAAVANGQVGQLETPEAASDRDSLFGDSPVDESHEGSYQVFSVQHELESAQPTQVKRKYRDEHEEMSAESRQTPKRVRHGSLP